jgi:hypothetical protein
MIGNMARQYYDIDLNDLESSGLFDYEEVTFKIKMKYSNVDLSINLNYMLYVSLINSQPGQSGTVRILQEGVYRLQMSGGRTGNGGNGSDGGFPKINDSAPGQGNSYIKSPNFSNMLLSAEIVNHPTNANISRIELTFMNTLDNSYEWSFSDPAIEFQLLAVTDKPSLGHLGVTGDNLAEILLPHGWSPSGWNGLGQPPSFSFAPAAAWGFANNGLNNNEFNQGTQDDNETPTGHKDENTGNFIITRNFNYTQRRAQFREIHNINHMFFKRNGANVTHNRIFQAERLPSSMNDTLVNFKGG